LLIGFSLRRSTGTVLEATPTRASNDRLAEDLAMIEAAMDPRTALVIVKLIHTVAWALLAGSVLTVPICAVTGRLRLAVILTVVVLCEIGVLAVNHLRCPLTDVAARFTNDRQDNFDIYLPLWLARYNKQIFGPLFLAGELVLIRAWRRRRSFQRAVRSGSPSSRSSS
jgi:hypothetical protein